MKFVPVRAAIDDREKIVKVWSAVAAAVVVVATMAVVLVSPLTLYRPSETVLIYFVLKLIFPKNKKRLKNS